MTGPRLSDREVAAMLGRRSARHAPDGLASAVLASLAAERERHPAPARRRSARRPLALLAAAALLLAGGAVVAGSGLLGRPAVDPREPAPSSGPLAAASPAASSPDAPTPAPSPTTAPIAFTAASSRQDWPAPVRAEPSGGASVAAMPPTYIDPSGDAGSTDASFVDIRDVTATTDGVSFDLIAAPPNAPASTAWIAYGVVVDENRDGVADWRYGIDNAPSTATTGAERVWRTDLHTGRTDLDPSPAWRSRGDPLDPLGDTRLGAVFPVKRTATFRFHYGADTTGGGTLDEGTRLDSPFYVWASEIVDGGVAATDYAPDTGWLVPGDSTVNGNGNGGGSYVIEDPGIAPLRISMRVPAGWTTAGPTIDGDGGERIEFLIADHPATWACDASGHFRQATVGRTVDDLATFLQGQRMIKVSTTAAATVDGFPGAYLEYTTAWNENTNCEPPAWPFEAAAFHQVWILDVDGVRLVIDASAPKASDAVTAKVRGVVDSIAFGP